MNLVITQAHEHSSRACRDRHTLVLTQLSLEQACLPVRCLPEGGLSVAAPEFEPARLAPERAGEVLSYSLQIFAGSVHCLGLSHGLG